jgi:hypothetical protein
MVIMIYTICKAKNKIASNEEAPIFNYENWEIIRVVKCRKNATKKTWDSIFSPIYQELVEKFKDEGYGVRFWHFEGIV